MARPSTPANPPARPTLQGGFHPARIIDGSTPREAVASLDDIEGGGGGYWEDRGYEWYAGI